MRRNQSKVQLESKRHPAERKFFISTKKPNMTHQRQPQRIECPYCHCRYPGAVITKDDRHDTCTMCHNDIEREPVPSLEDLASAELVTAEATNGFAPCCC